MPCGFARLQPRPVGEAAMSFSDDDLQAWIARERATSERLSADMKGLASVLARWRDSLRAEGFQHEEAFELVRDYFTSILDRVPTFPDEE